MAEVKIEIGENLAGTVLAFAEVISASEKSKSIGDEVQKAFGIDISKIAKEKILMDTALEKGLDIQFENDD